MGWPAWPEGGEYNKALLRLEPGPTRDDHDVFAITYKVTGTDDVFVTTAETRDAMNRHDIPYNSSRDSGV